MMDNAAHNKRDEEDEEGDLMSVILVRPRSACK